MNLEGIFILTIIGALLTILLFFTLMVDPRLACYSLFGMFIIYLIIKVMENEGVNPRA